MMYAYGTDRQPRGAALVIVMLVMAVLLLAGTTFMTISSTESQIALNERVSVQASLLAEAAIHKAIAQLNANPSYPGESNTGLGGGNFTSTVTTAAAQPCGGTTNKDVVATATVPVRGGQAQVTMKATVDQISYPYRWGGFAAVDYLFLSSLSTKKTVTDSFDSRQGSFDQSNNLLAGGDIGANGGLYLWNVDIKGSAQSGAWISNDGNSTAIPQPVSNVPLKTLPNVLPNASASSIPPITGNTPLSPGTYVTTSINMPDNSFITTDSGPVTLYVTGSVTLGASVTLGSENLVAGSAPATNLTIITKSDGSAAQSVNFIAGNNFRLFGSLYGKNTNIILGDNAKVYGSMIGRKITRGTTTEFTGNWSEKPPIFHFDQAMYNKPICTANGKFAVRRGTWREVIP